MIMRGFSVQSNSSYFLNVSYHDIPCKRTEQIAGRRGKGEGVQQANGPFTIEQIESFPPPLHHGPFSCVLLCSPLCPFLSSPSSLVPLCPSFSLCSAQGHSQ